MPPNLNQIAHHPEAKVVARFEHEGLDCVVLNMRDRHYCGYVKTPFDGHFEEFQDYVDVHGGLTYGLDESGWVGFDTAHAFDLPVTPFGRALPNNAIAGLQGDRDTREWNPEDVMEETARLAEQIAEIVPEGTLQEDEGEILE
jgi:hypothetical protein